MKQNLIFVVILLVTLSMVNAIPYHHQLNKRATTFKQCSETLAPITVTLQPDPPVPGQECTFTVTGTIDSGINPGTLLVAAAVDSANNEISQITVIDICSSGVTCPTTSLSVTKTMSIDASLPGTYSMLFTIGDENKNMFSCAVGAITG